MTEIKSFLETFPDFDGSVPIEFYKVSRENAYKAHLALQSPLLKLRDEAGKPLYTMTSGGNIRRTKKVSKRIRAAVIERDGNQCVWCGSEGPFEVDHIIRYRDGGSNEPGNLQTLCEPCHRSKGGK